MRPRPVMITVLHYTGYTADHGGIVSVIRALQGEKLFRVLHGVSAGYARTGPADPEGWSGPAIEGEKISLGNFWRARFGSGRWQRVGPGWRRRTGRGPRDCR